MTTGISANYNTYNQYAAGPSGDNEAAERVPDNEAAEKEGSSATGSSMSPSRGVIDSYQGTRIDILA